MKFSILADRVQDVVIASQGWQETCQSQDWRKKLKSQAAGLGKNLGSWELPSNEALLRLLCLHKIRDALFFD